MDKLFFLVPVLAIILLSGCIFGGEEATGLASAALPDETVSISLENISGQAKFFEYDLQGTVVRFFAVKGTDGGIKTAFDACDVCGYAKKGYRQEGSDMVCNNCGNRYPIEGIGTENKTPGGCWPGYLPSKIVNGNIVIQKSGLDNGKERFA